ncbi:MAG: PAS domain S-box protein, partial [Deltaproteobacteria bacterium]|nr:PAS domain S-box protein [Deltaproteobacteria bacterium]
MSGKRTKVLLVEDDPAGACLVRKMLTEEGTILDHLPGIVFFKDRQSRYVMVNRLFTAYKHCLPLDVVGKSDFDIYSADQAQKIVNEDRRIFETGEPLTIEHKSAINGRVFQIVKVPLKDLDGAITGIVGMTFELTERVRAEEALKESEENYRTLFNSAGDAIFICDLAGKFLEVNDVSCERLGYSRAELLAITPWDLDDPANSVVFGRRTKAIQMNGSAIFETVHVARDGRRIPTEISSRLINYRGSQAILSIVRDITERKRAEESRRQSEEKHRVLYESSRDSIMILEPPTWRFTAGNPSTIVLFGAKEENEFITKSPCDLSPERQPDGRLSSEKAAEMIGKAMDEGSHFFEWTHRRLDGTTFSATVLLTRVELGGKRFLQATVRDITEQKKLEGQLVQAHKLDVVGQLAGGVAHDFNNILSVIISYSDFLLDGLPKDSPLAADAMEIKKAGQRAADLTRQLLAFSRKQQVIPRSVDVNEAIRGLTKMLGRLVGEHLTLDLRLGAGAGTVLMDPSQLEQIFMNLAVNARDAMPGGGRLVVETKNVALDEDAAKVRSGLAAGGYTQITVSDSGTGMPPEIRDRIFEPFFTTKGEGKGTGLGLSVVYGAVKQNRGHIEVQSEVGLGTTFRLFFPCAAPGAQADAARDAGEAPRGRGETIMLVEDDEPVRRSIARTLLSAGYKVIEAPTG